MGNLLVVLMIENEREAYWLIQIFDSASSHNRLLIFLVWTVTNIYDNEKL